MSNFEGETEKMTRGYWGVGSATLVSRILGYIRDMFMAFFFGTQAFADAFYVAFRIPNLLRQLLGEGSMSAAFIPVYCESLEDKEKSQALVGNIFTVMFGISLVISVIGIIIAPTIVKIIAPGFRFNKDLFSLTVKLTRIMFPILIFVNLSTIAMGILNAKKYFTLPAATSAFFNGVLIVYFIFARNLDALTRINGLAWAIVVGFFVNFAIMLPTLIREKCTKIKHFFTGIFSNSDIKKIFILLAPAVLGISMMEINVFVDTICASLLGEGVISAIYYAHRINQLPLALFGVSISMVSLPFLSLAKVKNTDTSKGLFSALGTSYLLIIPSTVGLVMLGEEIIKILFQRGSFVEVSTQITGPLLKIYALALPALAGIRIFATHFYSQKDTKTPVIVASFAFLINTLLDVIAMFPFGASGLAAATTISAYFNFLWLGKLIIGENVKPDKIFFIWLAKIILASAVMVAVLLVFKNWNVLIKIPLGAASYFVSMKFLKKIGDAL